MQYLVKFVGDEVMPDGHQWAICHVDGKVTLYLRESARAKTNEEAAAILASAWDGYRKLSQNQMRRATD